MPQTRFYITVSAVTRYTWHRYRQNREKIINQGKGRNQPTHLKKILTMVKLWPSSFPSSQRQGWSRYANSAVVETMNTKPRISASDPVLTAIGLPSMDSMDIDEKSQYEAEEDKSRFRQCHIEQHIRRQKEENSLRKRQAEERLRREIEEQLRRERETEERWRCQEEDEPPEELIKQGQKILQTKTGEVEEVKFLVLDQGGDTSHSNEGEYDDFSDRSGDSDSCSAIWHTASDEENILVGQKVYEDTLAEAEGKTSLNENKQREGSTTISVCDKPNCKSANGSHSVTPLGMASEHVNERNITISHTNDDPATKKKGTWNGLFNRLTSSNNNDGKEQRKKKEKFSRREKTVRRKKHSADAAPTNKITSKKTRQQIQEHSKTAPGSNITKEYPMQTGRGFNSLDVIEELKSQFYRKAVSVHLDRSEETNQRSTAEINSGTVQLQQNLFESQLIPTIEPRDSVTNSKYSASTDPTPIRSNRDWTPVDPEATLIAPSNLQTNDSISQMRDSFDRKEMSSKGLDAKTMNTDEYYENAFKINGMPQFDAPADKDMDAIDQYQKSIESMDEMSKESSNRYTAINNGLSEETDGRMSKEPSKGQTMKKEESKTVRRQSEDWSQQQSLNPVEKSVQMHFDGLKSWFVSAFLESSGSAIPTQKAQDSTDKTENDDKGEKLQSNESQSQASKESSRDTRSRDSQDIETRSRTSQKSDGLTESVSKRVKELSGALSGEIAIAALGSSAAYQNDQSNDVSQNYRPIINPSSVEVVSISSIEIPAIENNPPTDDEYSVSVLGLNREKKGEIIDDIGQQQEREDGYDRHYGRSEDREDPEHTSTSRRSDNEERRDECGSSRYEKQRRRDVVSSTGSSSKLSRISSLAKKGGSDVGVISIPGRRKKSNGNVARKKRIRQAARQRRARSRSQSRSRSRSKSKSRNAVRSRSKSARRAHNPSRSDRSRSKSRPARSRSRQRPRSRSRSRQPRSMSSVSEFRTASADRSRTNKCNKLDEKTNEEKNQKRNRIPLSKTLSSTSSSLPKKLPVPKSKGANTKKSHPSPSFVENLLRGGGK